MIEQSSTSCSWAPLFGSKMFGDNSFEMRPKLIKMMSIAEKRRMNDLNKIKTSAILINVMNSRTTKQLVATRNLLICNHKTKTATGQNCQLAFVLMLVSCIVFSVTSHAIETAVRQQVSHEQQNLTNSSNSDSRQLHQQWRHQQIQAYQLIDAHPKAANRLNEQIRPLNRHQHPFASATTIHLNDETWQKGGSQSQAQAHPVPTFALAQTNSRQPNMRNAQSQGSGRKAGQEQATSSRESGHEKQHIELDDSKKRQFENIIALAANAAKMGAMADDTDPDRDTGPGSKPTLRHKHEHKNGTRKLETTSASNDASNERTGENSVGSMQTVAPGGHTISTMKNRARGESTPASPSPSVDESQQQQLPSSSNRTNSSRFRQNSRSTGQREADEDFALGFDEKFSPMLPGSSVGTPLSHFDSMGDHHQQHRENDASSFHRGQQQQQQDHNHGSNDVDRDHVPPTTLELLPRPDLFSSRAQHHELDIENHHSISDQDSSQQHHQANLLSNYDVVNSLPSLLDDSHQTPPDHHYRYHPVVQDDLQHQRPSGDHKPSSGGSRESPSIRVVFNNNPHFIIGSNTRELPIRGNKGTVEHDSADLGASMPLQRRASQPSGSLYDDYHQSDESAPEEFKVHSSKTNHSLCQDEDLPQHHQVPSTAMKQTSVMAKGKSSPPPTQVEHQQHQQVDIPLDQMIKSGIRPPLRMLINMQNKDGHFMKVPINFRGSTESNPASAIKVEQSPSVKLDVEEMQIQVDRQEQQLQQQQDRGKTSSLSPSSGLDENTPIGGDIFDPSLSKTFEKPNKSRSLAKPKTNSMQQSEQSSQKQRNLSTVAATQKTEGQRLDCDHDKGQEVALEAPIPIEDGQKMGDTKEQRASTDAPIVRATASKKMEHPQQKQEEQQHQIALPAIVNGSDEGLVSMLKPKLTQSQNQTFATMLSEFQRAVSEHMTNHLANEQQRQQEQQEHVDDDQQEDLMVAMLAAANMSRDNFNASHRAGTDQLPVTMTVIKPPKGTSVQEAIRNHAKAGQTMAILSSPRVTTRLHATNQNKQTSVNEGGGNSMVSFKPPSIEVSLRPRPQSDPDSNSSSEGGQIDPDGFSSSSSSESAFVRPNYFLMKHFNGPSERNTVQEENLWKTSGIFDDKLVTRFKRSLGSSGSADARRSSAESHLNQHFDLEPEDKISSQTMVEPNRVEARSKKQVRATGGGILLAKKANSKKAERRPVRAKEATRDKNGSRTVRGLASRRLNRKLTGARPTTSSRADGPSMEPADDNIVAAASQQSEVSSDSGASDDQDDDQDDDQESDGSDSSDYSPSGSSSSSSASDNEEPSVSASGDGSGGDESDYGGDMGDDFDDSSSSSFDNDDEPYNQAAASDRDYSGDSSASFEIPSIDINPDTLQQKGCRTVLREVQEIPLNGLGVVQANGQPGSGYSVDSPLSSSSTAVGAVRVKRQSANNDNLINSRKVTSIVMTKECHFPNDASGVNDKKSAQKRRRTKTRPTTTRQLAGTNQGQQVEAVAFGNQAGASQASMAAIRANGSTLLPPPPPSHNQRPVLTQQTSPLAPQHYQSYQVFKAPREAIQKQVFLRLGPRAPSFYGQAQSDHKKTEPSSYHSQQQQQPQVFMSIPKAGAYAANPGVSSLVDKQRKQQAVMATVTSSNQLQPSASSIMRRSVSFVAPQQPSAPLASRSPPKSPSPSLGGKGDLYLGAASRVIARKLYKPPSEDDPFHTLSYSSQTGADPDMEQDEDDSVVMGSDGGAPEAASSSRTNQSGPRNRPAQSQLRMSSSHGTLSERERAALMDPNHDDTDPVAEPKMNKHRNSASKSTVSTSSKGRGSRIGASNNRRPEDEDIRAGSEVGETDADENDADLTDETRASQLRHAESRADNYNPARSRQVCAGDKCGHSKLPDGRARITPPVSKAWSQKAGQSVPRDAQPSSGPPRFGKSFKFEHSLSRVGADGKGKPGGEVAAHLRQLKPGLQGYVSVKGKTGAGRESGPLETASQLKSLAATIGRRSDDGDDIDDADEDDDDEADGRASSPRLSSSEGPGRRQMGTTAQDDDSSEEADNPDADPEFNPRESHLPANTKPKRFEKSFAYVHRDLPKKGARNPDDFVVSYGRGNLQTEHEDYDSDRDNSASSPQEAPAAPGEQDKAAAARSRRSSYSHHEPRQNNWQLTGQANLSNAAGTKRLPAHVAGSMPLLRYSRAIHSKARE